MQVCTYRAQVPLRGEADRRALVAAWVLSQLQGDILDGTSMGCKRLRRTIAILILTVAPFLVGFGPPAYVESDEVRMPLYASEVPKVQAASLPEVTAAAAVAIDGETGQVLYDKNAHARRAPASMTKIATAIVALEHGNASEQVSVNVNGWAMQAEGSSVMGLTPGEVISLEGLLAGLMVPSGNDAAVAIAEHIGGTVERFVEMMNAKMADLGLKDTHFVNPHGLDDEAHYSSAYDLAQMARYAMRYPLFAELAKTEQSAIAGQKSTYYVKNTNPLLGAYPGADGVKTGYTENAGYCVVGSATRDGRRVFITLMDSPDRLSDGSALFDYAFKNYTTVSLTLPVTPLYSVATLGGASLPLRMGSVDRLCLPLWQVGDIRVVVRLSTSVEQPVSRGQVVGEVVFYPGDQLAVTVPLYAGGE